MDLGIFSVSLNVKDLAASKAFYEKLGFEQTGGDFEANYLIMKNGETVVGLFHGMFEKNILTFNPGLTLDGRQMESFADVRDIERALRDRGVEITHGTAEAGESGPAHIVREDPDGNPVLIDQFF
ncbi:VOC family protein [Candidatus Palauibacter sp.]|uniref:VOC family protein n=1 Tax=Candidatus Palauibacter sp. TaxID=3101350 RepID=UPI003B5CA5F6